MNNEQTPDRISKPPERISKLSNCVDELREEFLSEVCNNYESREKILKSAGNILTSPSKPCFRIISVILNFG